MYIFQVMNWNKITSGILASDHRFWEHVREISVTCFLIAIGSHKRDNVVLSVFTLTMLIITFQDTYQQCKYLTLFCTVSLIENTTNKQRVTYILYMRNVIIITYVTIGFYVSHTEQCYIYITSHNICKIFDRNLCIVVLHITMYRKSFI